VSASCGAQALLARVPAVAGSYVTVTTLSVDTRMPTTSHRSKQQLQEITMATSRMTSFRNELIVESLIGGCGA